MPGAGAEVETGTIEQTRRAVTRDSEPFGVRRAGERVW
jgi:hypothetical protein